MSLSTSNLVLSNTAGMIALGVVGSDGVTVKPVGPSNPIPTTGGGGGGGSSLADNLIVDAAGVYWILQDQGGGTFVYYKLSTLAVGTPTAPVVPAATSTGSQVVEQSYDVITAGTGYAVGDILLHIAILNVVVIPPTILTSAWINITQGTVLATAPLAANIVITPTNQAVTAADGALATIGTKADVAWGVGSGSLVALGKATVNALNAPMPSGTNVIGGITISDGSAATIGAKADAAYAGGGGSASAIALYKGIYNVLAAPLPAGTNTIGTVGVTGSVAVTGTFWQATQPISAAALPLPTGAATAAGLTTINTTLGTPMQQTGGTVALAAGTAAIGTVTIGQGSTTERTAATSITTGGTAQLVEAATAARIGFTIQNTSTGDLWFSTASTTPSAAPPAFRLPAGMTYETPENWSPTGAFYIYGATTGQTFTYRSW